MCLKTVSIDFLNSHLVVKRDNYIMIYLCGLVGKPLKSNSLLTSLFLRKLVRKSWLLTQLENQKLSYLIVPLQFILQIYFISSYAVLITVELFKIRL